MEQLIKELLAEQEIVFMYGEANFSVDAHDRIMNFFVCTDEFENDYVDCGILDKVGAYDAAMKRARETTAFQDAERDNDITSDDSEYNAAGSSYEKRGNVA